MTVKTVAAYTPYSRSHALTLLRLVDPLELAGVELLKANEDDRVDLAPIASADVVVVQRDFPRYEAGYAQVIQEARARGVPVVYETDDLLLELPDYHPDRPIHYYTPALFPILQAIIEADAVTASTPDLCEYLRPFNPNTWLLPNYLDDRLWRLREAAPEPHTGPVVIGYAGSSTHGPDLDSVCPVLLRLLERYGERLRLRFWGGQPPEALRVHPQVELISMQIPYPEFAAFLVRQELDLWIAPLIDNPFNRCKSPIKYFECSALGLPGVYGRVSPYAGVITHGEDGYLAAEPEEWETCLARLIEDPQLRREMGGRALETVRRRWLLSQHANEWPAAYGRAIDLPADQRSGRAPQTAVVLRVAEEVREWHSTFDARLAEKDQAYMRLVHQLEAIQNSTGYRLLQRLLRLRSRLIPEGSGRERLLKAALGRARR